MTFYQWVDFLRTEADGRGLEIEWLNLDETSVPQSFVDCQGNIARVGPRQLPCHNIPLHRRRGCATFVCVVAASARLQAVMPQVWIGNKRVFRAKDLREVAPEIPHNCLLWREATSWNTALLMEKILTFIAERAATVLGPRSQLALVFDCASVHLTRAVLQKAQSLSIWIVLAPTACTHAVQPADTHVFAGVKAFLRNCVSECKMRSPNGTLAQADWLRCCLKTESFLKDRPWRQAFLDNGILGERHCLSAKLRDHRFPSPSVSPPPSYDLLSTILPKACQVHYWDLFGGVLRVPPLVD